MKKKVLLYALCACIFTGCKDSKETLEPDDRQVDILFSAKATTSSFLKSTVTPAENLISKVILFGVDVQNNVIENYAVINNPPLTGIQLTISKDVKSLYAIANPSTDMEATKPSSVSDLMNLVGDFTNAPQSPFLMGGNGNVIGDKVNIELIRAVAKIEIIGKNGFQIATVTVKNTTGKGYVFRKETFSVPASASMVNYPAINTTNPILYVAENSRQNPTQFVVTGQLQGKQASYTIVLTNEGQNVDIVRNTHYQVDITPITESECIVTITIPAWSDATTDDHVIPDENFAP